MSFHQLCKSWTTKWEKRKICLIKTTYNLNSWANESIGDNVPDVKMIDPTPNWENESMASPGLKHHQLSVLDAFPAA